jgi:uncharacterized protein (TIGR03437 family)
MRPTTLWSFALFVLVRLSGAAATFPLGMDYSRQIDPSLLQAASAMAVDGDGNVYFLGSGNPANIKATTVLGTQPNPASFVLKLTPSADRVVYVTLVGLSADTLAVDPAGNAYVTSQGRVVKLNGTGTELLYSTTVGDGLYLSSIAVDRDGHAYVTGWTGLTPLRTTVGAFQRTASAESHAFVVKLSADGASFDYATYLSGSGTDLGEGIALDATGAAFVLGRNDSADFPVTPGAYLTSAGAGKPFLARLAPDGTNLIYATFTGGVSDRPQAVAADPEGNALVALSGTDGRTTLLRFNAQGTTVAFSKVLPPVTLPFMRSGSVALDAAGNAYFTGITTAANYPVKDSLTPCGSVFLSVFDAAGNLIQSTYVGGDAGIYAFTSALGLGPNSTVYVAGPTKFDPLLADGQIVLVRLSPGVAAHPVSLACLGNAASFDAGPIAAGEILSLFGQGLGPATGMQPDVSPNTSFPAQLANVAVTFDGTPGPLLYVQDGQINAIAPWRLTPGQTTQVCFSYNGSATNCIQRMVVQAAPGVFMADSTHAAALNQDGTINSATNPAQPGSIVSIFATGLGLAHPAAGRRVDSRAPTAHQCGATGGRHHRGRYCVWHRADSPGIRRPRPLRGGWL